MMSPFQMMVPSKSTSTVITSGGVVGGGGLPTGMLSFTACVCTGMVMMSMMISTSITSMSGVVLMSIMTSGSASPEPEPTDMAMCVSLVARGRLGDEADLEEGGALGGRDHAAHGLVARLLVGADVHLGLRHHDRDHLQLVEERPRVAHVLHVPEHVAILAHGDHDVLGLGHRDDIAFRRQLHRDLLDHHRDGDQEDDEQHQHHVDE